MGLGIPATFSRAAWCSVGVRLAILGSTLWLTQASTFGTGTNLAITSTEYRTDQILVQPKRGSDKKSLASFHALQKAQVLQTWETFGGLQVVAVPAGETAPGLIGKYQQSRLFEFAEPDFLVRTAATV